MAPDLTFIQGAQMAQSLFGLHTKSFPEELLSVNCIWAKLFVAIFMKARTELKKTVQKIDFLILVQKK